MLLTVLVACFRSREQGAVSSLDAAPSGSVPTDGDHPSETAAAEEEASEEDPKSHDEDLALRYATMTLYEVAYGNGIEYTVDGLQAGDVVTTSLDDKESVVKKDGPFDGSVVVEKEPDVPTDIPFAVYVERAGETVKEMFTRVDLIVEGDRGEYDDGILLASFVCRCLRGSRSAQPLATRVRTAEEKNP